MIRAAAQIQTPFLCCFYAFIKSNEGDRRLMHFKPSFAKGTCIIRSLYFNSLLFQTPTAVLQFSFRVKRLNSHWFGDRRRHFAQPRPTDAEICDWLSFRRLDNGAFDEDANSLADMGFDSDQIAIRSPPSVDDDAYSLYYPQEQR